MTWIDNHVNSTKLRTLPRVACITTGRFPPELQGIPVRRISGTSRIENSDEVVLLHGRGMGRRASALADARSAGRTVPPVVIIAPDLDRQDILEAFSRGPVSYSLEPVGILALAALLRWSSLGQCGMHPAVIRTLVHSFGRCTPSRSSLGVRTKSSLTGREQQIMALLAAGNNVAEIAEQLFLAQKTVRNNLTRIFAKLQVRGQAEAILRWHGLV